MANRALDGKVALVAGATRGVGRGGGCMLGASGAVVYRTDYAREAEGAAKLGFTEPAPGLEPNQAGVGAR